MYCDQCGQPLSDQSTRCTACDTADPAISPPLRFPTPTSALVADPYQPLPGLAPLMPVDDPGFRPEERSGLSPSQIRGLRRLTSLGLADPCRVLLTGDGNAPEATMVVAMLARAADDRRFRTELVSAIATRDFGSVLRHLKSTIGQIRLGYPLIRRCNRALRSITPRLRLTRKASRRTSRRASATPVAARSSPTPGSARRAVVPCRLPFPHRNPARPGLR